MGPTNLEQALLDGRTVSLAEGALVASGVRRESELSSQSAKVDELHRRAAQAVRGTGERAARDLFDWLWRSAPRRWQRGGSFRLTDVLDAQLAGKPGAGNCLGLTLLYNILAQRMGLEVRAVHLEQAFGAGPHVLTLVRTESRSIDVEHMFPHGFGYTGHKTGPAREEWGDRELIGDVYHSAGCALAGCGRWEDATECYRKAVRLNPGYLRARLNLGIALVQLGHPLEARQWLTQAVPRAADGP